MGLLEVHQLEYAYPDGRVVLQGVSFQVDKGEKVGLLGLNGAGKSTLLLCLAKVLKPTGVMTLTGDEQKKEDLKLWRQQVGLVFQDPNDQLFMATVFDDVAFGPQNLGLSSDEVSRRVETALSAVGATGFSHRITHHLSFGEKKRVALATILAMRPEILLLDEPSSNLDPKRRREFISIINEAPQAMLIASHDISLVRETCSRVLILQKGAIVQDASAEILHDADWLARFELY